MALNFISKSIPREWWSGSPTSIPTIRTELQNPDIPEPVASGMSCLLDEMEPLMQPGDELYRFSSPSVSWQNMMGRGGFVIVREGTIVHAIMMVCN
jgi:hypothetical protein